MTRDARMERDAIVRLLREETHLQQLADLIEAGGHHMSEATLDAWCEKHSVDLRRHKGAK